MRKLTTFIARALNTNASDLAMESGKHKGPHLGIFGDSLYQVAIAFLAIAAIAVCEGSGESKLE